MKTTLLRILWCIVLLCCTRLPAADTSATWIHAGVGNWDDPVNWEDGVVPRNTAHETFDVTIALTNQNIHVQPVVSESLELNRLRLLNDLHAGTIETSFDIHIRDEFHWSGGSLTGWKSRYHTYGDVLFDGISRKTLDRYCELFLHGSARWTDGNLHFSGNGHVWIPVGGELIAEATGYLGDPVSTSSAVVHNRGTFVIRAPSHTAFVHSPFMNEGLIDVDEGTMQFRSELYGGGKLRIGEAGTLVLSGHSIFSGNEVDNQGMLLLRGHHTVATRTRLNGNTVIEGTMDGGGDIVFHRGRAESAMFLGKGNLVVEESGFFKFFGEQSNLDCVVENHGVISMGPGIVGMKSGSVLSNLSPAVLELKTGLVWGSQAVQHGLLSNHGVVRKDDGQGQTDIYVGVVNRAEILIEQGSMAFHNDVTNSAHFKVSPGAKVVFGDELNSTSESSYMGLGAVDFQGWAWMSGQIDTNLSIGVSGFLDMTHPLPVALGSLTIHSSPSATVGHINDVEVLKDFTWRSGALIGPGTFRTLNTTLVDIKHGYDAEIRTPWVVEGTTHWVGGMVRIDKAGAKIQNSGTLWFSGAGGVEIEEGEFVNTGALRTRQNILGLDLVIDSVGASLSTIVQSVVEVEPPGIGPFQFVNDVVLSPGRLTLSDEASVVLSSLKMTNAIVRADTGAILEVAESAVFDWSRLEMLGGQVCLPDATEFNHATISGMGSIDAHVSGAGILIEPTRTNTTLRIRKSLTMNETGVISVALAQSNSSLQTSKLVVDGPLRLAGELRFSTPHEFLLLTNRGPVAIIESNQEITGSFNNVTSGEPHTTADGAYRFVVYYGPESPYPHNQVVLESFGSSYDIWRNQELDPAILGDEEKSGPDGDANDDGNPNIVDFVFGAKSRPRFDVTSSPGHLLITIVRRADSNVHEVDWYGSPDLKQWQLLTPHRNYLSEQSIITVFLVSPAPDNAFYFRSSFRWPQ